ncbi:hypothetical protein ACEWY4_012074 [Coilia grayii]|uniref:Uncharacterized protein n=1 Tax=Coilia grayii TaxID=363190 RepID=A0ABD1JZH2_9TELE
MLPWIPESPRYLLIEKNDESACDKALKQLHGEDKYHGEKADMDLKRLDALGVKPWEIFSDESLRWQLVTIILLNTLQQLSGINAGMLIESLGRRLLLIGGYSLMALWCICFTLTLTFQHGLKQYCFLVFLVISVMVAIYTFLIVPETKNKTFLEIHAEFQNRSKRSKADGPDGTGTTLFLSRSS